MDQSRRLKRLAGLLLGKFLRCQPAQLLVDEGQELLGGVRIAPLDGGQDTGNLVHRRHRPVLAFWTADLKPLAYFTAPNGRSQ